MGAMPVTFRACPPAIKTCAWEAVSVVLAPVNDGALKMPPECGPAVADFVEDWRLTGVSRLTSFRVSWRPGGTKLPRVFTPPKMVYFP